MTIKGIRTGTGARNGRHGHGVERRSVLKLAVGAAAAGGLGAAGTTAHASGPDRSAAEAGTYDVIVVGAGFAGVTAARELRARGLRPLIVEARSRIGGRAWTDTFSGKRIELGANWFSQHQALVAAELQRYGINLVHEGVGPERAVFPTADGGFENLDAFEAYTHNDSLIERLFEGSREYLPRPLEPLYAYDRISAVDGKSLRDRLGELRLSARDERWLSSTTAAYSGGDSAVGGLTALAQWWALPGHTVDGWYSLMGQIAETGMRGLLERMLADAQAQLVLESPVTTVIDDGRGVTVVTRGGRRFTAASAVVAVPANVWKDITFQPGLPPVHAELARQGSGIPHSKKFWARVRGDIGLVAANGAEGFPVSSLFSYHQLAGGEQLMIGFCQDTSFDVTNLARLNSTVRQMLPKAEILAVRSQDWGKDPYARGGWALRRPGQLLRHLPAVQRPHGRIAFANDGIASGWNGFIDGAIETGKRAAEQVTKAL
ncbi:flavin monoamine oxidase family protein [Streptomyces coeruleorubidus]|uniref:flavin monoamine oxidase family protein n=1 Tax=Streptomyces coeruleorubidus TaxID=116188 RepID=UPI00379CB025